MSSPDLFELQFYQELADRWLRGSITAEEKEILERWYEEGQDNALNIPSSFVVDEHTHETRIINGVNKKIRQHKISSKWHNYKIFWYSAAAVAILLIASSAIWSLYNKPNYNKSLVENTVVNDVAPGQLGATLHLSNGTTIALDSLKNGTIAIQDNVKIVKENGELKYIGKAGQQIYNEISTGRGKEFKMVLPDGTKVWLNSASSIHYPLNFTGKERVVAITGEAYFEVVHDAKHPFKVKVGNQVIEDIGTAFDVNAYSDEPAIKTTLLHGAVKIGNIVLKPGQQMSVSDNNTSIKEVNVNNTIAWVKGQLSMEDISIQELMKQLSRWYDVDVLYEGKTPAVHFGGIIDRNVYLSNVINVLKEYGVKLKLQDKKIIVSPK